jgi:hydroxymethylglutaryl-CoA lyase
MTNDYPLLPAAVVLEEQGLRDGLQTESVVLPTAVKLDLVGDLLAAGVKRLQVCSFVNPAKVPQMADAEEFCRLIHERYDNTEVSNNVIFSALVLNAKGVKRASDASLRHVSISLSASNTHSKKNTGMSLAEAKAEVQAMTQDARAQGMTVRGGIQSAFGCRYEGAIDENVVLDLVQFHLDCGAHEIAIADSTGMGNPVAVRRVMHRVVERAAGKFVVLHQHDTENKGLANVFAALEAGVTGFDTAFGGLGGCPFIRGATGNIATEDTVHMLDQMGIETGVDKLQISAISRKLSTLLDKPLPGKMHSIFSRNDTNDMNNIRWI